ncbi:conserved hypothetical protein [Frankia canadensis]|uniref:Uncharacterized protein n=1 Tax=Frankia canadensis TaxID=1836972 RepID=A0A2I2KTV2_9ACTN|nr:hypothetical protein [Frankia canadensis]SNQ49085.1 conserved hypothetical protein [Frankia canadensis]SOU56375.1 conserved hypothetical protein [Frankia canadensis]
MPKNYGPGVAFGTPRAGGLRSLVRLGRRELWLRLDRNMLVAGDRGTTAGLTSPGRVPRGSARAH